MIPTRISTAQSVHYIGKWDWSRPEVYPSDAVEAGGNASNCEIYTCCCLSFVYERDHIGVEVPAVKIDVKKAGQSREKCATRKYLVHHIHMY